MGVQPGPGPQLVPGRDHSTLLLPTCPSHCPRAHLAPAQAQAHPKQATSLTSKRAVPLPTSKRAVPLPCVCPASGECGGWSFRLPLPSPQTLSPLQLCPQPPSVSPGLPSCSAPLTSCPQDRSLHSQAQRLRALYPHAPPPSLSRENHALHPPPGLGERKGKVQACTEKGPTPSCLWFCHRFSSCPAQPCRAPVGGDTGGPGWAVPFCL